MLDASGSIGREDVAVTEFDHILAQAKSHGVQSLLYSTLDNSHVLKRSDDLRMAAFRHAAVFRLQDKELERVCERLNQSGIRYLLIKGAAICYQLYPQPEIRPRVDTDVFIAESDIQRMKDALTSIGYEPMVAHDGGLVSYQTGMKFTDACALTHVIDIHWNLSNRHEYRDILGFELAYASSVSISRFSFPVYAPGDVFALCLACQHLVGHHSDNPRLIWLYDMRLLLQRMSDNDIDSFVELVTNQNLEGAASQALTELNRHFNTGAAGILDRLGYREGVPLKSESRLELLNSNLNSFPTLSSKLRYLTALAFPPIEYMEKHFSQGSKLLIPWHYLYRILRGGKRILAPGKGKAGSGDQPR
jgi:hypothetical protein